MRNARFAPFVVAALLATSIGACGGSDDEPSSPSSDAKPSGSVALGVGGGDLSDVYADTWFGPLEEGSDLTVENPPPPSFAQLKAQADSGNSTLDVANIASSSQYLQAIDEGLVEPLDRDLLQKYLTQIKGGDLEKDFIEGSIGTHGVWDAPYAVILMYDKRVFPDSGPQPDSLDDLWNFDEFPGKRCINNTAIQNLDIALAADGVPADDIYPMDVDRALAKLDEVKPEVAKFWVEATEPIQLVSSGECVMSTVFNGRPYAAEVTQGIDYLGVAWEHGKFDTAFQTIPKGAPNRNGAYLALAYYLSPEAGIEIAEGTGYATGNKQIDAGVKPATREYLATTPENLDVLIRQDPKWWLKNGPATEEKFADWLSQ